MKKQDLKSLIVLGLLSGSLLSTKLIAATDKNVDKNSSPIFNTKDGNMGYQLMTEDELLLQLNDEGTKIYESLSPEGKKLALKVASQRCDGQNECKHLNACSTSKNKCAGQSNDCKGTGKCAFSDPNLAVKAVQKKMAEKRQNATR